MEELKEIRQDLKEVKTLLVEMSKQQAIDHHILKEHEKRSTTLQEQHEAYKKSTEERLKPLEDDKKFWGKTRTMLTWSVPVLAAAFELIRSVL